MSKFIGRLTNVGLAKETPRGNGAAPTCWLPKSVVTLFDRAIKYNSRLSYGSIGHGAQAPKIMEWAEGSIEGDVMDTPFGLLLLAVFGVATPTGPTNGTYSHAFTLQNDAQHDSLTITLADPDRTDRYTLAMLDSLIIKIVPGDTVTFVANFKSRTGKQVATAVASWSTYNKFLGRHATIKVADAVANLDSVLAISVKSLTLKFSKNTILDHNLGTVWPDDILNTKFDIEGEIELNLEDQTYRDYMLDASYKALRVDLTNRDVIIGTSDDNPKFTLDLSRVHFEGWEKTSPNDDIVSQKITFRALFSTANNNIVNACTLVNTFTSY